MRRLYTLTLLLWLGTLSVVHAADMKAAGAACVACHGAQGEGNAAVGGPPLAAQREDYLARQMRAFRSGVRGYHPSDKWGAVMRQSMLKMTDADMTALAAYFAALPAPAAAVAAGDVPRGRERYKGTCAACHGARAEGYDQLQSPGLRTLPPSYISTQMANYVKGWRGAAPEFDQPSLWMRSIAVQVSDLQELADIAAYIQSMR